MTAPRKPAPAPPKGFRPYIHAGTKLRAALRAAGIDPDLAYEWHHSPPLQQRVYNTLLEDTEPSADDDRYLVPVQKAAHREQTAKHDVPEIAKTKRLAKKQEAFRATMLKQDTPEPKRKRWGSRPFRSKP